jgi:hypothetical protein
VWTRGGLTTGTIAQAGSTLIKASVPLSRGRRRYAPTGVIEMTAEKKAGFWGPVRITIAAIGALGSVLALLANADPAIEGAKRLMGRWTAPPALETTWQGQWASSQGFRFTFAMKIDVTTKDEAEGQISWRLDATPPGSFLESRIGSTAFEYVHGTFDREKKLMQVEGLYVSDPTLIETDRYRLQVEKDGLSFIGMTEEHGEWSAQTVGSVIISEIKSPAPD